MLKVRCQNRDCEKLSNVDEETIFCQYCGRAFATCGIDIPKLVRLDKERSAVANKYLRAVLVLCAISILLIPIPLLVGWSDYDSNVYTYSILGLFVISVPILSFIQSKHIKNRFPELYNQ